MSNLTIHLTKLLIPQHKIVFDLEALKQNFHINILIMKSKRRVRKELVCDYFPKKGN